MAQEGEIVSRPQQPKSAYASRVRLEAAIGFEPMHGGFADLSLNHLGTPPLPLLSSRPNPINYHARESASIEVRPHWRSPGPELPDLRRVPVSDVPSQISCIWPAGCSNSGESLSTLLTSGETGVAISKSLGAGTSKRLSAAGSGARGSIQSSASRSASIT